MDTGINRKVTNQLPVYLGSAVNDGNQARLDTVTNTERGMNLRFKHASRRLRVPHIHPGYVTTWKWYPGRAGRVSAGTMHAWRSQCD